MGKKYDIENSEMIEKFFDYISRLVPYKIACVASGFSYSVLKSWKIKGLADVESEKDTAYCRFVVRLYTYKAEDIKTNVLRIQQGEKNWQSAAWLLERVFYEHFSVHVPIFEEMKKDIDEIKLHLLSVKKENSAKGEKNV